MLWQIRPSNDLWINCHFFDEEEIEFSVDPREIVARPTLYVFGGLQATMRIKPQRPGSIAKCKVHVRPRVPELSYPGSRQQQSVGGAAAIVALQVPNFRFSTAKESQITDHYFSQL